MRIHLYKRLVSTLLTSLCLTGIFAQSAAEILQKSLDLVQGTSSTATLKMQIVRESWTREISLKSWSLGTEHSLIRITAPARDEGTTFLKRGHELWNWQPRIERTIKMPPSMLLQSWMGSDFTNDDLVRESSVVEDYTHKLLRQETLEGKTCHVIELTPKAGAPVVWGKVITWITTTGYMTLKTEFYDEDDILVNTMTGSNIRRIDGRDLPTLLEVVPAEEPGNKTIITYESLDFDIAVDETFFSVQNMKLVK